MAEAQGRPRRGPGQYQIGEIARRSHLSLRTLRYWEDVGLIRPTARTDGGFRLYSDAELDRAKFIRAMKPSNLTIEELRELVDLTDQIEALHETPLADASKADAIERLECFISRIRSRCEVLRGRIDEAEAAALQLEALIEVARSPD